MKKVNYIIALAAACFALGLSSCCTKEKTHEVIEGKVVDATMNNIMLVTDAGDTVNISTMDADPAMVPGVLLEDRVSVECERQAIENGEILQAVRLTVVEHSPYYYISGTWVQPNPIDPDEQQGMTLNPDGTAQSVGMATLLYKSWVLDGKNLILSGESLGNKQTIEFSDTLTVLKLDAESLVLADDANQVNGYLRQE